MSGPSDKSRLRIDRKRLLIVEGRDEELFFVALLEGHLGRTDVQVLGVGGKTQIARNLQALVRDPGYGALEAIAIVRDADLTAAECSEPAARGAWKSVTDAMARARIPVPSQHAVFVQSTPRTGVFILPDGQHDGMLETLCVKSIEEEPAYSCLQRYFDCLTEQGIPQKRRDKGLAHAYLASRPEPDKRVGEAAQAGYWPWESPAFASVIAFLRAL